MLFGKTRRNPVVAENEGRKMYKSVDRRGVCASAPCGRGLQALGVANGVDGDDDGNDDDDDVIVEGKLALPTWKDNAVVPPCGDVVDATGPNGSATCGNVSGLIKDAPVDESRVSKRCSG